MSRFSLHSWSIFSSDIKSTVDSSLSALEKYSWYTVSDQKCAITWISFLAMEKITFFLNFVFRFQKFLMMYLSGPSLSPGVCSNSCPLSWWCYLTILSSAWRRKWHPTPVFLPGEPHGRRSLVGYSPRVAKSRTRLSNITILCCPLHLLLSTFHSIAYIWSHVSMSA